MLEVTNFNNCVHVSDKHFLILSGIIPNEDLELHGINIYPNPSSGHFEISINRTNNENNIWYYIIDLTGRKVYNDFISNTQDKKSIKLDGLNEGIYVISFFDGKHTYSSKIMIKK